MLNLQIINDIAKSKNISINELIEKVGITKAAFYAIVSKNSTKIETLEKIAETLTVPISIFFNEIPLGGEITWHENENQSDYAIKMIEENELLLKRIAELEEQLNDKRTIIEVLKRDGVINGYNLYLSTLSEDDRIKEITKNLIGDIDFNKIEERPFDFKDQKEVWEEVKKLAKSTKAIRKKNSRT